MICDELLGVPFADVADLGTSHEWRLRRVTLADGRMLFVKETLHRIDGLFAAEASGRRDAVVAGRRVGRIWTGA